MSEEREYPQNWTIPTEVIDYEKTISDLRASLADKDKQIEKWKSALRAKVFFDEIFVKEDRKRAEKAESELAALREKVKEQSNQMADMIMEMRG